MVFVSILIPFNMFGNYQKYYFLLQKFNEFQPDVSTDTLHEQVAMEMESHPLVKCWEGSEGMHHSL